MGGVEEETIVGDRDPTAPEGGDVPILPEDDQGAQDAQEVLTGTIKII